MEMRTYFNGVVRDNLEAIMALKAELSEQKKAEAGTNTMLQEVVAENQRLAEPLAQVRNSTSPQLLVIGCICTLANFCQGFQGEGP